MGGDSEWGVTQWGVIQWGVTQWGFEQLAPYGRKMDHLSKPQSLSNRMTLNKRIATRETPGEMSESTPDEGGNQHALRHNGKKRDTRRDKRIHTGVVHQFVLGAPSRKDLACGEGEGAVVSTCMLGAPSREAARL